MLSLGLGLVHVSSNYTRLIAHTIRETLVGVRFANMPKISGHAWVASMLESGLNPNDWFTDLFTVLKTWSQVGAFVRAYNRTSNS